MFNWIIVHLCALVDLILTLLIVIQNRNRSIFNVLNINALLYTENKAGLVGSQLYIQTEVIMKFDLRMLLKCSFVL